MGSPLAGLKESLCWKPSKIFEESPEGVDKRQGGSFFHLSPLHLEQSQPPNEATAFSPAQHTTAAGHHPGAVSPVNACSAGSGVAAGGVGLFTTEGGAVGSGGAE